MDPVAGNSLGYIGALEEEGGDGAAQDLFAIAVIAMILLSALYLSNIGDSANNKNPVIPKDIARVWLINSRPSTSSNSSPVFLRQAAKGDMQFVEIPWPKGNGTVVQVLGPLGVMALPGPRPPEFKCMRLGSSVAQWIRACGRGN